MGKSGCWGYEERERCVKWLNNRSPRKFIDFKSWKTWVFWKVFGGKQCFRIKPHFLSEKVWRFRLYLYQTPECVIFFINISEIINFLILIFNIYFLSVDTWLMVKALPSRSLILYLFSSIILSLFSFLIVTLFVPQLLTCIYFFPPLGYRHLLPDATSSSICIIIYRSYYCKWN